MSSKDKALDEWIKLAEQYTLPDWERLSSIPLYMDQVLLFMSEVFDLFENDGNAPILTSSMINNYVKNGLVEHPVQKKYNREHLAKIMMIGMLKQVLSIQEIALLFSGTEDIKAIYAAFTDAQNAAFRDTLATIESTEKDTDTLRSTALRLVAEANARRAVAEQILLGISETPSEASGKAKKNQKNK